MTNPVELAAMREARREEKRKLEEEFRPQPGVPIDMNTASLQDIEALPSVGPTLAERIVKGRPYKSVDDLRRVPGIGEKVFAQLKDSLQVAP